MILILSSDQFSSSVISKIFLAHGIWFGECSPPDMFNPHGGYENRDIKALLIHYYGGNIKPWPLLSEKYGFMRQVCDVLERQGYSGGRWAYVADPVFQNCFDSQGAFKIAVRPAMDKPDEHDQLDTIPYQLYLPELMEGHYRAISKIFTHCQIPFKKEIADEIIGQSLQAA